MTSRIDPAQIGATGGILAFLGVILRRAVIVSRIGIKFESPEQTARIVQLELTIADLRATIDTLRSEIMALRVAGARHDDQ